MTPPVTPATPSATPLAQLPLAAALTQPTFLTAERKQQNLLVGGTFEGDVASKWKLSSFRGNKLSGAIEGTVVKEGQKAAALRTTITDDTHFDQTVAVKPGTRYLLSGWIKTKAVAIEKVDQTYGKAGATLSIWGGYEHSRSIIGNTDWTYVTLIFDARDRTEVTVCARLGYWFSVAAGEAWFDDLNLIAIGESPQRPTAQPPAVSITTNKDWKGWPKDTPPPAISPFNAEQAKQHQEAWAKHLGVPVEFTNSIGLKFRLIPPGEYLRGSTPQEIETELKASNEPYWQHFIPNAGPQHKVILTQAIYVGAHEVTQQQYARIMGSNPAHFSARGAGKNAVAGKETGNHPVEDVSWNSAAEFCAKLSQQEKLTPVYARVGELVTPLNGNGYRLPTEAEWEFACRSGTTTKFWISDAEGELAKTGHYLRGVVGRTHPVGELKANPFGLFDTHGNVWEWAQDGWVATAYGQFLTHPAIDPSHSWFDRPMRAIRGGCWLDLAVTTSSSVRHALRPDERGYHNVGFRVAISVAAVKAALANRE